MGLSLILGKIQTLYDWNKQKLSLQGQSFSISKKM